MTAGQVRVFALLCALAVALLGKPAVAAETTIVALGASNVEGRGISGPAFPARLQAKLKRRGLDVRVINAGRSFATSEQILAGLGSSVPSGTSVVILAENVRQATNRKMGEIERQLRSRGIAVIRINFRSVPHAMMQRDRIHTTDAGQELIASRLVPQVENLIKRKNRP
jgi:acyl-CoA thioesterase I